MGGRRQAVRCRGRRGRILGQPLTGLLDVMPQAGKASLSFEKLCRQVLVDSSRLQQLLMQRRHLRAKQKGEGAG